MTIEHNVITDPNIHEPKGFSTATANQLYFADGAGSGTFKTPRIYEDLGWEFSRDDGTTPQVFTTTPSRLSINGLGANTTSTKLPPSIAGSDTLWDTTTDFLTPIAENDYYHVRFNFPCTAVAGSPTYLELQVDIGGGSSPSNVIYSLALPIYKTPPFTIGAALPIFISSVGLANGVQFFLNVDAATSATLTGSNIFVSRAFNGAQ